MPPDKRTQRDAETAKGFSQVIAFDKQKVIKATTMDDGKIVGFAMWTPSKEDWLPAPKGDSFLARYIRQLIKTRKRMVGGKQYWYLAILAVDSPYWRRGIGGSLVQWGLDRAENDRVDCCYLESSPMGQPLYESKGFEVAAWDCIVEKEAKEGYVEWPVMIWSSRSDGREKQQSMPGPAQRTRSTKEHESIIIPPSTSV